MLHLLPRDLKEKVQPLWKDQFFHMGTFCSGTDVCIEVNREIFKLFGMQFKHVFSCDCADHVLRYIKVQLG